MLQYQMPELVLAIEFGLKCGGQGTLFALCDARILWLRAQTNPTTSQIPDLESTEIIPPKLADCVGTNRAAAVDASRVNAVHDVLWYRCARIKPEQMKNWP